MNEKAQVTFPDNTEISCVILGEDELGNYKCSALESNGKYKQGDIFYCNEDTHEIVKTAKLTKLSGLKNLLSNEIKKYQWGFDNHKSPWKYNKITGMIEKDPEAVKKLAKLLKTALDQDYYDPYEGGREALEDSYMASNSCPWCGGEGTELGQLGKYINYKCRNCGMTFKAPDEFKPNDSEIKSLSKLIKSAFENDAEGLPEMEEEEYQMPAKEVRYAVEADFYISATSDEEAFKKADILKDEVNTSDSGAYSFEIKNVYKIPTGTMNFDNQPLQRQSKLGGLRFLLSHALDPKIETKFDNSLKAVKYHLFQYSGNDDVKELQTVADYLNDLLMVTKEQIANHHKDDRPEFKGSHSSEQATFNAMQGGTD